MMQYSMFGSIYTIGGLLGAALSGKIADLAGRKGVGSSILETFPNQNVKFILVTSSCNFVIVFLSESVDNKCINMNPILNFCKAGFLGYEHCRRCGVACYNILQGLLSFFDFLGNTLVDPNTEKDDEE